MAQSSCYGGKLNKESEETKNMSSGEIVQTAGRDIKIGILKTVKPLL